MHWTDKNTRKQIQNDHSLIYQSESWFNKSLPGGSESWTHLDLPHLLFSMEKTDLDFIGLHTWKKFTPYAKHNRTASVLLPNLRQYSGSKHFKAQWWHTDSEPPVFNKELQWNLKTIHVHLRNPPTIERYQHNLMTVTILNQKEESSFDCLSLTAVFKKNQATGSSDYMNTTASTSLIPHIRPIFLYFSSRLENWKNPWLQYTAGRQASWSKLFTGTTGIQAM